MLQSIYESFALSQVRPLKAKQVYPKSFNLNAYLIPYISHNLGIQTISCCVWCVIRSKLVNFWKFRCRRRLKKGLLQLWLLRTLKKNFKFNFQKPMWFYLLTTNNSLMGKVWGKTFFQWKTPWTALTEIASWVFTKPIKKILFGRLKEVFKAWNIDVCHTTSFPSMAMRPTDASWVARTDLCVR